MTKPDFSKSATIEDYYKQLAGYWEFKYDCAKAVGDECLERLIELEEIRCDDSGSPYWAASGEQVGGV